MQLHIHMQQTGVVMLGNRQEQGVFVRQSRHRNQACYSQHLDAPHDKTRKAQVFSCLVFQSLLLQHSVSQSAAFPRQQEI